MASPHRQRENKFYEPGIRGRKTGATVPANLQIDKDGLENVDDFFNSDGVEDDFDGPAQVTKSPRRSLANELMAVSARTSLGALKSPSSPRRTVISSYRSSNRDNTNSEQVSMDIATTQSSPKRSFKSPLPKSSPASRRTSSVRTPDIMPDVDDDEEPVHEYAPASDKVARKLDFSLVRQEPQSHKRQAVVPSPVSGQKRRRGGTMLLSQQRVARRSSSDMDISEGEDNDDDDEPELPALNNKQRPRDPSSGESEEESEEEDLRPQPQPKRKQTVQRAGDYLEEEEEEDEEDRVDPVIPSPARRVPISPALSLSLSPSPPPPQARPKAAPARTNPTPKPKAAPAKKKPGASPRPAAKMKPKPSAPVRTLQRAESVNSEADGTRRSNRQRIQPLDFWRNERIVYGSRKSGENVVPVIRQVVRVPSEEPEKRPRKRATTKTKKPRLSSIQENPEAGMDKDTDPIAIVKEYETEEEIRLQIACTANMIQPRRVANASYFFEKVFTGDFISSGVMHLQQGGFKEAKLSGHNTFMFYIIEGAAEVTVHLSTFVIATGGMFMVPRGNEYQIRNVADRMTKMFFTQARMLTASVQSHSQSQSQSQR